MSAVPIQVTNLEFKSKLGLYKPGYRFNVGKYEIHDERNVLLNEIVFDLDWTSYIKNYVNAKKIIEALKNRRISFYIYHSGGKGVHIHIFFKSIEFNSDSQKELFTEAFSYNLNWKKIRLWVWNKILDEAGIDERFRGKGKQVDSAPISFDYYSGSSHLIRDCGGRKISKKPDDEFETIYKTFIDEKEFKKVKPRVTNFDLVKYPEVIEQFEIDVSELCLFLKNYVECSKNNNIDKQKNEKLNIKYLDIEGVCKIREGLSQGQRNLGALVISIACNIDGMSKTGALNILKEYVDNCEQMGHVFNIYEAEYWLNWVYNLDNVYWNCKQLKELDVHDRLTCEFCQAKYKKSLDFLKSSTMLKKITEVLKEEIVGEEFTSMLIFLLLLSKDFKSTSDFVITGDPISQNIILSSDSASGKSYVAKRIMKLFGTEGTDYFVISRLTKNAINYFTEVNMDSKIMFIEEMQGLDENTSQIRVWMSEGRLVLSTVESVKNEEGIEVNALVSKTTIGQPSFITCQAEGKIEEQMLNRGWVISMDVSEVQTKQILLFQDRLNRGEVSIDKTAIRTIKDSLKQLKSYHFKIPYIDCDILGIPSCDVRARRDYDKFLTLIRCSAHLHQYQREIVEENNIKYIICNLDDYEIARKYSRDLLGATFSGLTNVQIDMINFIKQSSWKDEFTVYDIQRNMGKSHTHWHGQLSQLENLGFVTCEKSLGRSTIYSLNDKKSLNIVSLPPSGTLKKSGYLKVKGAEKDLNFMDSKIWYFKVPEFWQNEFKVFKVFNLKSPHLDLKHVPTSRTRKFNPQKPMNLHIGDVGTCLRFENVLDYIKNHPEHIVSISDIEEHFAGKDVEKLLEKLIKNGDIFEPKAGRVMVL